MTRIFHPRRFYRAPAYGSANASIAYRSKLPVELYLLSVAGSSEGDVMRSYLFKKDKTIIKEVHLQVLRIVVQL